MGFFSWGKKEKPPVVKPTPRPEVRRQPPVGSETMPLRPVKKLEPGPGPSPSDTNPHIRIELEPKPAPPKEEPIALGPPPEPIMVEPLPEEPIMVEPLPEEELVEVEPMPDESVPEPERLQPVELKRFFEEIVGADDERLSGLAKRFNDENPGGLYFIDEWDESGYVKKISPYTWYIEKIHPVKRIGGGKNDTIHKVVLHPIGNPDVTKELTLVDFDRRLRTKKQPGKDK